MNSAYCRLCPQGSMLINMSHFYKCKKFPQIRAGLKAERQEGPSDQRSVAKVWPVHIIIRRCISLQLCEPSTIFITLLVEQSDHTIRIYR